MTNEFADASAREEWMDTELTEDELMNVVLQAKKEKYYREKQRTDAKRYNDHIARMKGDWEPEMAMRYLKWRAVKFCGFAPDNVPTMGKKPFKLDEDNCEIYHALCYYFTFNPAFELLRFDDGNGGAINPNWSLNKGLLIVGSVGSGKTKLMELFAVNKRQNFEVINANEITHDFAVKNDNAGFELIKRFSGMHTSARVKHEDNLWQEKVGLCIDDIGTEEEKNYYGNKSNVIAEILLGRYANKSLAPHMTHGTTNLSRKGVEEKYGVRVWSRMQEMFNIVQLSGNDRRKMTGNAQ